MSVVVGSGWFSYLQYIYIHSLLHECMCNLHVMLSYVYSATTPSTALSHPHVISRQDMRAVSTMPTVISVIKTIFVYGRTKKKSHSAFFIHNVI